MSHHHLPETVLTEYSAGCTAEPLSLMVATHVTLCKSCRDTVRMLDEVGGVLLEDIPQGSDPTFEQSDMQLPASMLALMFDESLASTDASNEYNDFPDVVMPRPLRENVGCPVHEIPWRKVTGSLEVFDIMQYVEGYTTRLMRVAKGAAMPKHTHEGEEYTLVLQGAMADHQGVYHRGDVAVASQDVEHSPRALDEDDCICLAVNVNHVRLTGPIGRWLNPFVKF